jgi:hypothetical protein
MQIAEIEKNRTERIRISLAEYNGHRFIDCRVYYQDKKDGEWLPSKKGMAMGPDVVDEVIEGLKVASAKLEDVLAPKVAKA